MFGMGTGGASASLAPIIKLNANPLPLKAAFRLPSRGFFQAAFNRLSSLANPLAFLASLAQALLSKRIFCSPALSSQLFALDQKPILESFFSKSPIKEAPLKQKSRLRKKPE